MSNVSRMVNSINFSRVSSPSNSGYRATGMRNLNNLLVRSGLTKRINKSKYLGSADSRNDSNCFRGSRLVIGRIKYFGCNGVYHLEAYAVKANLVPGCIDWIRFRRVT